MSTVRFPHAAQTQERGETCGREAKRGEENVTALCFCTDVQYLQFNLCHDVMALF